MIIIIATIIIIIVVVTISIKFESQRMLIVTKQAFVFFLNFIVSYF